MAKPIVLCSDSTCDLSPELLEKYHIHLCPVHITYDDKSFLDGVDINVDDVYRIYREEKKLPKTAATNMAEYMDFVRPFIEAGNDVIYVTLGSGLSSIYNNCCMAAEEMPGLYPVDSANLSTGCAHTLIAAAERIEAGMPVEQIVEEIRDVAKRVESSFVLDTLEFLHKGGRCSTLAMMGANVLKLRPCIEVNSADGTMTVGKKYRGARIAALKQYIADRLSGRDDIVTDRIFLTNSGITPEEMAILKEEVQKYQHFDEVLETIAGCTISSHCGPGCFGILFVRKG